ncbi:MAG: hypothetical protein ACK5N8_06175 [Alphaproteobacteria bacterium]
MKPLIVMMRILIVGCFWSIFFLEGIRVIMLRNWRFDIISYDHWEYAWDLWMSGWVISDAKEWAFVLILLTFIPLWITGWAALSIVNWENIFLSIFSAPLELLKKVFHKQLVGIMKIKNAATPVKRKLSYKEVRPKGTRPLAEEPLVKNTSAPKSVSRPKDSTATKNALKRTKKNVGIETTAQTQSGSGFQHSLLSMDNNEDEDDDFVFNFDAFDVESAPEPKEETKSYKAKDRDKNRDNKSKNSKTREDNRENNRDNKDRNNKDRDKDRDKNRKNKPEAKPQNSGNIFDIIKQKGYEIITGTTIKNTLVDFIGVSKKEICVCLLDREPGDWLADEEKFNDEEPLWFSESSHRISPVRKADIVKKYLEDILSEADYNVKINAFVIIQLGNIINAEDMLNTWNDMNISVTRIDRGTPKDIMLFTKALGEADEKVSDKDFEEIKKLIRNIK